MGEQNGCKLFNFSGSEEPGLSTEIAHLSKKDTERMPQHLMVPALLIQAELRRNAPVKSSGWRSGAAHVFLEIVLRLKCPRCFL